MGGAAQAPVSMPRPSDAPLTVVKLGGSVVRGTALAGWLDIIGDAQRPIVLVPGGGALADEVRGCQRRLGFSDATAHRMALLAMDQLAWAIAGLRSGYAVGTTLEELCGTLQDGRVAVWAPAAFIAGRPDVEATWRLTSDSLALWLAGKLEAAACCVVKSAAIARGTVSAPTLSRKGIVDEAFPAMLAETDVVTTMFGRGDETALAAYLSGSEPAAVTVTA